MDNVAVQISGTQGTSFWGNYGGMVVGYRPVVDGVLRAEPVEYEVVEDLRTGAGDLGAINATFQKMQLGSGTLKVTILFEGKPVATQETSDELGIVSLTWNP